MSLDPSMAALSDYADALVSARRAKRAIVLLLLLALVAQIVVFYLYRSTELLTPLAATTKPANLDLLTYVSGGLLAAGLMLSLALPIVLLLICHIMLVGRLIGVGPVVSSFVWSLVLALMLFPWQTMLNVSEMSRTDFVVPGVLYTWRELVDTGRFSTADLYASILKWTRFVGAPVLAVLILLTIQLRSGRGMRLALGEDAGDNLPA
jgi:hypothetical protein